MLNMKYQIYDSFLCSEKKEGEKKIFTKTSLRCPFIHVRLTGSLCFSHTKMSQRLEAVQIYSLHKQDASTVLT